MKSDSIYDRFCLVLIDVQLGFNDPYWGKRNNPQFEKNAKDLIDKWRSEKREIIHVQHLSTEKKSPLRPERKGSAFMEFANPFEGEAVFQKNVNSAFIGTDLEEYLKKRDIKKILLAGLTTDHCVSTSARMAKNLGFDVTIATDATATFDRFLPCGKKFDAELVFEVSLASLNGEFATLKTTGEILY